MNPEFDVFVVGDYCLDLIFTGMPSQPQLGKQVIAKRFNMTPGGGTCNSVIAMHRLGLKVAWAVDFGSDSFSQFILDYLRKEGIDPSFFVHSKKLMRKITISLSYPDDRSFIAYYDPDPLIIAGLKKIGKVNAKVIYIPAVYYGIGLDIGQMISSKKQMKLIMDGNDSEGISLKNYRFRRAISMLNVFFLNASEAVGLTGESDLEGALNILGKLCPMVVIKAGAKGAYGCKNGEIFYEKGIKVNALDTTGAGDCFNAGFIKAWLSGKSMQECLRWGNIVGGLSTLGLGGIDHITREFDVYKWLKKYG
jgi:sugar/nucleoside kinase (ribokinase family)